MRNANGYGSITKLSGRRRKPYMVRVYVDKGPEGGKSKKNERERTVLGYFETKAEATEALVLYHKNPINFAPVVTLYEVYELWSESKFAKVSDSAVANYKAAIKKLQSLWNIPFKNIRYFEYQEIIDNMSELSYSSRKNVASLLSQLYIFAIKNEFLTADKNVSTYIELGENIKSEKHYPFRRYELEVMWRWAPKNDYVQMILIFIYTGARPKELFDIEKPDVHLDEDYLYIRKGKTNNATRRIPIHKDIRPFIENWMNNPSNYLFCDNHNKKFSSSDYHTFYDCYFIPVLSEMGILNYTSESGEPKQHLPYDCRHTFTTLWKENKLDESMRRKIQGHSGKGIGEIVYTHFEFEVLRREMNDLPTEWKKTAIEPIRKEG